MLLRQGTTLPMCGQQVALCPPFFRPWLGAGTNNVCRAELKMRKANVELCKQRKEEDSAPSESLPYVIQVLVPFIVNFAWVKTLVSVKALDSLSGECPYSLRFLCALSWAVLTQESNFVQNSKSAVKGNRQCSIRMTSHGLALSNRIFYFALSRLCWLCLSTHTAISLLYFSSLSLPF